MTTWDRFEMRHVWWWACTRFTFAMQVVLTWQLFFDTIDRRWSYDRDGHLLLLEIPAIFVNALWCRHLSRDGKGDGGDMIGLQITTGAAVAICIYHCICQWTALS